LSKNRHRKKPQSSKTTQRQEPAQHRQPPINVPNPARIDLPTENNEWRDRQQELLRRQATAAEWLNWITAGAAVVGLLGLAILWGTLDAINIQTSNVFSELDVMRKAERAWIATRPGKVNTPTANVSLSSQITMINTGKTPARQIVGNFYIEIVNNGDIPHFGQSIPHSAYFAGAAVPNEQTDIPIVRSRKKSGGKPNETEEFPLTTAELNSLENAQSWIAVHGTISYYDVFRIQHLD